HRRGLGPRHPGKRARADARAFHAPRRQPLAAGQRARPRARQGGRRAARRPPGPRRPPPGPRRRARAARGGAGRAERAHALKVSGWSSPGGIAILRRSRSPRSLERKMNDDPEKEAPNGEPRPEPTWREPQAAEERYTPGSASEEPRGTDTAQSASEEPRGTDDPQSAPDEPRIETDASQGTWEEPRPHRSDDARRAGLGEDAPPPGGEPPIARHLKSKATWLRLVFIVLFAIVYGIVELVLTAV